jgi:nucleoside-diphosphate-sugar epimerase
LAQECHPGEVYNIGGDTTLTIREMLGLLLETTTYRGEIDVKVDQDLLRPADVTLQVPSSDKFKAATGWEPQIPYRQTLSDMLNYWRGQISNLLT